MKTLYLDCSMGAAGDMLTAALAELLPDPQGFVDEMNSLGIPGVHVEREQAVKCGITGTHISVLIHGQEEESVDGEPGHAHGHSHGEEHHSHDHAHGHGEEHHSHNHSHDDGHHSHDHSHSDDHHAYHHHHSGMHEIQHVIEKLPLEKKVQEDVLAVYGLIAQAESHAHGVPVEQIHFHEVGTMDAIADITAVCLLLHKLAPEEIIVSPIHVGSGRVKCAHGILPVPAPATAFILQDVPVYGGQIKGELCTPTGAALLKHFATRFGDMPVMRTKAIGYGMGKKDFEMANCLRAMLGETESSTDMVVELSCNVDDMTAEMIGFAMDILLEEGALEVFAVPVGMKKSRPGTLIQVLCAPEDKEKMVSLIFQHTTTIGIRENQMHRYVLERKIEQMDTPYGKIRRKRSEGYGVCRDKYEYDDLCRIARENHLSLDELRQKL